MQRRVFIAGLAGAAAAWPLATSAQQAKIPVIGILYQASSPYISAFRQGLREAGYIEGQNIVVEDRPADRGDRLPNLATELVGLKVRIIVAEGSQAVRAAQQATKSIPIVMTASSDPVGTGFVASLARPGGNITGMSLASPDLAGKRLALLREVIGDVSQVVVLWNPDDPPAALALKETESVARALGINFQSAEVRRPNDFDHAFTSAMKVRPKALVILPAPIMDIHVGQIVGWALQERLPAISYSIGFPKAGGLMSYGPSIADSNRRSAVYVDKLLKGGKPADLPVEQPIKFELDDRFHESCHKRGIPLGFRAPILGRVCP